MSPAREFSRFLVLTAAMMSIHSGAVGQEKYDTVIRNGRVLDGLGNPWV